MLQRACRPRQWLLTAPFRHQSLPIRTIRPRSFSTSRNTPNNAAKASDTLDYRARKKLKKEKMRADKKEDRCKLMAAADVGDAGIAASIVAPSGNCPGCGAKFQSLSPDRPGYLPLDLLMDKPASHSPTSIHATIAPLAQEETELGGITPGQLRKLMSDKRRTQQQSNGPPRVRICQTCHRLRYHNVPNMKTPPDFIKMFAPLRLQSGASNPSSNQEQRARKHTHVPVLVNVVDVLDLPHSLIRDIESYAGSGKPSILVVNKMDALPDHGYVRPAAMERLEKWLRQETRGVEWDKVVMVSARDGTGVMELVDAVQSMRVKSATATGAETVIPAADVHLLGRPNVGKSMIINALRALGGVDEESVMAKSTTSVFPGTTVGLITTPLKSFGNLFRTPSGDEESTTLLPPAGNLVDTPGIFSTDQLTNFLDERELRLVVPTKELKPVTEGVAPGQSVFVGGLARVDVSSAGMGHEGDIRLRIYRSNHIPIVRCGTKSAERRWEKGVTDGSMCVPKVDAGNKARKEGLRLKEVLTITVEYKGGVFTPFDISLAGIGWISVLKAPVGATLSVWAMGGWGASKRPALFV
ncbi:hypothetical protein HK101_003944 [Irineochytrium annulatum]|nr:hypothetical protein HK101_003944 [Irineochytrium annulatum]